MDARVRSVSDSAEVVGKCTFCDRTLARIAYRMLVCIPASQRDCDCVRAANHHTHRNASTSHRPHRIAPDRCSVLWMSLMCMLRPKSTDDKSSPCMRWTYPQSIASMRCWHRPSNDLKKKKHGKCSDCIHNVRKMFKYIMTTEAACPFGRQCRHLGWSD